MVRPAVLFKLSLIFLHRWIGVVFSIFFLLWFASGIVMMYWGFPAVTVNDRRDHAPVLDPSRIRTSPQAAYSASRLEQPPAQVRLGSFDGRPVYRFSGSEGVRGRGGGRPSQGSAEGVSLVYADDGSIPPPVSDATTDRAAASWSGLPLSEARKELIEDVDQWTVGANLRSVRPLYKYSFADGQQVYVSGRSAEVVQYTTRESRFWAYVGAIPHWLYFTPLRKHQPQWSQFVVWSSGIGTLASLLGLIVAIWMWSPARRYRRAGKPTSIPYVGWKRWHMIAGLFFGVVTTTWVFSGMLSMGPFPWIDRIFGSSGDVRRVVGARGTGTGIDLANALRRDLRLDLSAYAGKLPQQAIASVDAGFQLKELEFTTFTGEPVYLANGAAGRTLIIPVRGKVASEFDHDRIMRVIREAAGSSLAELRLLEEYDSYYIDRHDRLPLPVIYARMKEPEGTRYYIDPRTARIAGTYSSRNRVNRWLYHGLHSLDFPWLYKHRPIWDIVVIFLMTGGTGLCVTSLILTWQLLGRKLGFFANAGLGQSGGHSKHQHS